MAQVFHEEPLDFVMFFSSLVAYIKNVKQSHYASGCAFEDVFAHWLSKSWTCPIKVMNWGYWGNGEMANDEDFRGLFDQIGLGLIHPKDGMEALEVLLSGSVDQMALINTTKPVVVEGMSRNERIDVYPKIVHLISQSASPYSQKGFDVERTNQAQNEEMEKLLCKLLFSQLQFLGLFADNRGMAANLISKQIRTGSMRSGWEKALRFWREIII